MSGRHNDGIRKSARRQLSRLTAKAGGKCHWCRRDIICIQDIPEARRDRISAQYVFYRDEDNEPVFGLFATVDHITPLSKGGRNHRANLVVSCQKCNQKRSKQLRMPGNLLCRSCGKQKNQKDIAKRRCLECRIRLGQESPNRGDAAEGE